MTPTLIGVLVFIGLLIAIPLLVKYSVRFFMALILFASLGAAIGWLLDMAFDTFPKLAIGGAAVMTIGLIGASLEKLSGASGE